MKRSNTTSGKVVFIQLLKQFKKGLRNNLDFITSNEIFSCGLSIKIKMKDLVIAKNQ